MAILSLKWALEDKERNVRAEATNALVVMASFLDSEAEAYGLGEFRPGER